MMKELFVAGNGFDIPYKLMIKYSNFQYYLNENYLSYFIGQSIFTSNIYYSI